MAIDPGTSSVVASSSCLVELSLAIFWAVFGGFSRFLVVAMVDCIPLTSLDTPDTTIETGFLVNFRTVMISQFFDSEQHMIWSCSFDHFFFFFLFFNLVG